MVKVILFVILTTAGHHPPQQLKKQLNSIEDCLFEVNELLKSPIVTKLPNGGSLQAGCVLQAEASEPL